MLQDHEGGQAGAEVQTSPRPGQDRNSSLKEVSNSDVIEVRTRKTDSWAYDNKGDSEAGSRC